MNDAAEQYVRLVLAMGEHDADYVDAYYGPTGLRGDTQPLAQIRTTAIALRERLETMERPGDPLESLRLDYLRRQTDALIARAEMLQGRRMSFDKESQALYDAVA